MEHQRRALSELTRPDGDAPLGIRLESVAADGMAVVRVLTSSRLASYFVDPDGGVAEEWSLLLCEVDGAFVTGEGGLLGGS